MKWHCKVVVNKNKQIHGNNNSCNHLFTVFNTIVVYTVETCLSRLDRTKLSPNDLEKSTWCGRLKVCPNGTSVRVFKMMFSFCVNIIQCSVHRRSSQLPPVLHFHHQPTVTSLPTVIKYGKCLTVLVLW